MIITVKPFEFRIQIHTYNGVIEANFIRVHGLTRALETDIALHCIFNNLIKLEHTECSESN